MAPNNAMKPGSLNQMKKQQEDSLKNSEEYKNRPRQRRPNYHQIHSKALPLQVYPLPSFIPQNPLSYVRILLSIASHYFYQSTSHKEIWRGYWDSATRSVHVTDPNAIRALWESGFFGKGSLSRSEPNWLDQEKKRLGLLATTTSEELTEQRRKEREWMKRERARVEQEILMDQIQKENGIITPSAKVDSTSGINGHAQLQNNVARPTDMPDSTQAAAVNVKGSDKLMTQAIEVRNQEHLQLSLEEAFFLVYALGVLRITNLDISNTELSCLFRQHSYFPIGDVTLLSPDDPHLVNYVVYQHYRSLGWVIREGLKFSVDYLLYESGPVFKHAAFAIMIVPSYSDQYWQQEGHQETSVRRRKGIKDWTWLHCVNRVQTRVLKTLVLCYVDVPPPDQIAGKDIGSVLGQYKVREFSISRWSANRNRD